MFSLTKSLLSRIIRGILQENTLFFIFILLSSFLCATIINVPADQLTIQACINVAVDGDSTGSVVTFSNGEDSTDVLTGFTITNGHSTSGGGIYLILLHKDIQIIKEVFKINKRAKEKLNIFKLLLFVFN